MAAPNDDLPSDYDGIVLGTGMTECIIAAALSRNGYKVLHLDRNDYYSADWASFHFRGLENWIKSKQDATKDQLEVTGYPESALKEGEKCIQLAVNSNTVRNLQHNVFIREEPEESQSSDKESASSSNKADVINTGTRQEETGTPEQLQEDHGKNKLEEKKVPESTLEGNVNTELKNNAELNSTNEEKVTDSMSKVTVTEKTISERDCDIKSSDDVSNSESCRETASVDQSNSNRESDNSETSQQEAASVSDNRINTEEDAQKEKLQKDGDISSKSTATRQKVSCLEQILSQDEGDENSDDSEEKQWSFTEIKSLWRKFNIDLMPKMLYCRGPMVELLISSDVAKYCEFKTVSRVLTLIKGKLEQVPCSRSDVFGSKQVSMIEKRMMMKFLTFCMDYQNHGNEYEGYEDQPFCEYLKSKKLSANVQHYIQHSIAMVTDKTSTIKGLEACQLFLQSLGRYGNTAFLWPVYGSGELPQCFCRMCAVFGGIYCLRRTAQSMIVDDKNRCQGIMDTEGQRLNCKWLILESSFASEQILTNPVDTFTSRAILITDRSLKPETQDHITLMSYPVHNADSPVHIFELPPSSFACPDGLYLVHLTCVSQNGAQEDFEEVMETLFQSQSKETDPEALDDTADTRPRVLWSALFEIADTTSCKASEAAPENVYLVGGPNHEMDFKYSIDRAKEIFDNICPGEEFLPKAPNPEDIIWDDGEGNQPTESGFEPQTEEETDGNKACDGNQVKDANQATEKVNQPCSETKEQPPKPSSETLLADKENDEDDGKENAETEF